MRQVLCQSDKLKMELNDIHKRRQHNDNPSGRDQLTARRRSGGGATYCTKKVQYFTRRNQ